MSVRLDIFTGDITRLRQKTEGFVEQVPEIEEDVAREFAEDLEDEIKDSVEKTFDNDTSTGNLKSNVEARRNPGQGGQYTVSANAYNDGVNYAAWHEYAENGHYAYFEDESGRNEELIRWALIKGIYSETWRVFVEPRSFMKPGVQGAIRKARKRMRSGRNNASTALQEAFK